MLSFCLNVHVAIIGFWVIMLWEILPPHQFVESNELAYTIQSMDAWITNWKQLSQQPTVQSIYWLLFVLHTNLTILVY